MKMTYQSLAVMIIGLLLLSSCTPPCRCYIRNHSNTPIRVKVSTRITDSLYVRNYHKDYKYSIYSKTPMSKHPYFYDHPFRYSPLRNNSYSTLLPPKIQYDTLNGVCTFLLEPKHKVLAYYRQLNDKSDCNVGIQRVSYSYHQPSLNDSMGTISIEGAAISRAFKERKHPFFSRTYAFMYKIKP